jgi:hypothetical protein
MSVLFSRCCCTGSCVGYQTVVQPEVLVQEAHEQNFEKIIDSDPHSAVTNQDPRPSCPASLTHSGCVTCATCALVAECNPSRATSARSAVRSLPVSGQKVRRSSCWSCLLQGYKVGDSATCL